MQRHWRHDHGFTSPDPLLTKSLGIPNACNRCHQDKDADWAQKYCDEWYGAKMERPARQRAQVIAQAHRGEPQARNELLAWLKQEEAPYWQAVTLGLLEPWAAQPEVTAVLLGGLEHTNPLVRATAASSLQPALTTPGSSVAEGLKRRLDDPVRSVRIAAASTLHASLDTNSPAGRELLYSLDNNADQPSGQMQKGLFCFARNDLQSALLHLQKAVAWDPYSPPLRQQLAVVLSALNRPQEALETLKEACRLTPRDAESHFQLGLAYHELGDLKNATEQLAASVQLEPRHARAWYNLGLAQNSLGEPEQAIESLVRAESAAPDDPRIPYARATILARQGQRKEASTAAKRALDLNPADSEAKQLLELLER
jgi:tetratricopeptide (TPR) repeat protein